MTEDRPLVSVVIPTLNAAATVARALASVAAQTYPAVETLVVDDGSDDETRALVAGRADRGVRLIGAGTGSRGAGGPAAARNRGIAAAAGRYVAFLDADDEWHPEKTARQVAAMRSGPDVALAVCDGRFVEPGGDVQRHIYTGTPPVAGREAWRTLVRYSFVHTSAMMADRAVLDRLGGFDPALTVGEDQDLWIRLARAGSVAVLHDDLVTVHVTPQSYMARNVGETADKLLAVVRRHLDDPANGFAPAERRAILAERHAGIGRDLYVGGAPAAGARLMLRAALWGDRPAENLLFLAHASPPGRWLKRRLRADRRSRPRG
jgi:glycosyltransferase involved in cell wall biosynthesis